MMANNFYGGDMNGGNTPYSPYGFPPREEMFSVQPMERKELKRQYFGTFMAALVHGIGSFVLAQTVFLSMMATGYEFRYTEDHTAIIDWQYNIAGSLPSILFGIGIFIFEMFRSKTPVKEYFRTDKIRGSFIIGFFGAMIFAYGFAMIFQNIMLLGMFDAGISPIAEDYLTETDLTPTFLLVDCIFAVILAPIAEELLFRGVILRRLSTISQRFAIFVSAAIFGMMHGNFLQMVLGFIMGIVLGYAAVKTGSLILPIAGHMFINLTATSTDFVEYFLDEDISGSYFTAVILMFLGIGLISIIFSAVTGKIRFPEYSEYHRKRTFPVMLTCVSFWVLLIYYILDIASKFGPVTDKLLQ